MTGGSAEDPSRESSTKTSIIELFLVFLRLGLTSFGGPVAHLAFFRDAFVVRRRWLDERSYADLLVLCHFLPGPASSQVGMAIGLQRGGIGGLAAAWVGFTLPSAILMLAFAYGVTAAGTGEAGWISGLKAAAVAVVAQAVLAMARASAPDKQRATVAAATMTTSVLLPGVGGQMLALAGAGIAGLLLVRGDQPAQEARSHLAISVPVAAAIGSLAIFALLLFGLPLVSGQSEVALLFSQLYRAGALVFGGGHVVLPLLEAELVQTGRVAATDFLAGYGAVQAVPGPLFSFAAFLGGVTNLGPGGVGGATISVIAIFLPSALLVVGVVPFWDRLRQMPMIQQTMSGINAGVVGLLAATLYDPVFSGGITSPVTMAIAVAAFAALVAWKAPAWAVVIAAGLLGAGLA